MNIARKMVYLFFDLPYVHRMDVVTKLGLTRDSDSELTENQRYSEYFKRATELGIVEDLGEAICLAGTAHTEIGDTMKEQNESLAATEQGTTPTAGQRSRPLGQEIPERAAGSPNISLNSEGARLLKPIPPDHQVLLATKVLAAACHNRMWNLGWWHDPATGEPITRNFGEMLALIHSEISEALEGHRKDLMDDKLPHRKMAPVELFDAVIRIFDLIGYAFPDDYPALLEKLQYNDSRADHKPENRAKVGGKKF